MEGAQPERCVSDGWRKSLHSADQGNCVEVNSQPASVLIRDSQAASGPILVMTPTQWAKFVLHIKADG